MYLFWTIHMLIISNMSHFVRLCDAEDKVTLLYLTSRSCMANLESTMLLAVSSVEGALISVALARNQIHFIISHFREASTQQPFLFSRSHIPN